MKLSKKEIEKIFDELDNELYEAGKKQLFDDKEKKDKIETYIKEKTITIAYGLKKLPTTSLIKLNPHTLRIVSNNIDSLPDNLHLANNIRKLNLSLNRFKKIPEVCFKMTNLEELDLHYNPIQSIEGIGNLKSIVKLNLHMLLNSGNALQIPEEISKLDTLESLDLSSTVLGEFSPYLSEIQNLVELNVSSSEISSIPIEITNMQNLRTLNLSNNPLKQLPAYIGELPNLRELYLLKVGLNSFPEGIKTMKNLENLQLHYNQIRSLPIWLKELKKLRNLGIAATGISEKETKKFQKILRKTDIRDIL